jgi:hypothetical protein
MFIVIQFFVVVVFGLDSLDFLFRLSAQTIVSARRARRLLVVTS